MIYTGILEILLRGKDASVKLSKQFRSVIVETVRDVAILETEIPADPLRFHASLVVKYRFRIIRLTLNLLQATATICTSRYYGLTAHIQYRAALVTR